MKIGTIYTLYNRRAGAELLFEKIVRGIQDQYPNIYFHIYCNKQAYDTLPETSSRTHKQLVPQLERQHTKAFWLEFQARKQVESDGLDLFWIPSGANSFPGKWNLPNVVSILDVGEYYVKGKYDLQRTIYRKHICLPRSISRAKIITTISYNAADALQKIFRLSTKPTVIYPGPNPRQPDPDQGQPADMIQKETGEKLHEIILTPGRTDYTGKGLDILLNAYTTFLKHTKNPPPLILVGPKGEGHVRLIKHLQQPALADKAKWLGRVSDTCIDALYSLSRFVIIPSRYEGFGFPILEAMQHHVPVICSNAGSLPEIAGDAALIFPSGNKQSLAANMLKLQQNHELATKLVASGKQQLGNFSWDKTIHSMQQTFSSCLTT